MQAFTNLKSAYTWHSTCGQMFAVFCCCFLPIITHVAKHNQKVKSANFWKDYSFAMCNSV